MNILVLNAGSNSLKFEIVVAKPRGANEPIDFGKSLVSGSYDDIGKEKTSFRLGEQEQEQVTAKDHGQAAELLLEWLQKGGAKFQSVSGLNDIHRVGHRVVHGGANFTGPAEINDEVINQIEALSDLAPLHNESALKVIRATKQAIPSNMPMIAVFDTVFHRTIPEEIALYPLPPGISERHQIRRYGFHGISHRYMMLRYCQIVNRDPSELKLITLHLEGGSSAAAIRYGQSVDTSMGFTPLEGLMMGTRCGDIDPAIVTYLMRKENLDIGGIEKFLNKECGLLGVSQRSADTRVLLKTPDEKSVQLALEMFSSRVRKYIGAYLAVLGGCDAVIFGGGIGENTSYVRERIVRDFNWCGATLDKDRNSRTINCEGPITTQESSLPVWVVPTNEGLMIAHDVANCSMSDPAVGK
jgi:acetate kinase